MKPNFALDLSHDGISLLHRAKGGWTLVGSVALDDPDMPGRLGDLRRSAAMLESGGFTTKLIIPNSQILYTTVDAAGPDDIAREVQIRSALDGLTPYPVGDLVFDWRAEGDRARVAVLARETMDEAESFAVEYKFNPVSFVARPDRGDFSGEPFFGKTRAATRLLDPGTRVEPDASPVPRNPRALELTSETRVDTPLPAADEAKDDAAKVDPMPAGEPPKTTARPAAAEHKEAPAAKDTGSRVSAPALAPFPPTPDEADDTSKSRVIASDDEADLDLPRERSKPRPTSRADIALPLVSDEDDELPPDPQAPASEGADDSTSAAFQTRRAPTPSSDTASGARLSKMAARIAIPGGPVAKADSASTKSSAPAVDRPAKFSPPAGGATPPPLDGAKTAPRGSPDRLRSNMADALSRPLPTPDKPFVGERSGPGLIGTITGKLRGLTDRGEKASAPKPETKPEDNPPATPIPPAETGKADTRSGKGFGLGRKKPENDEAEAKRAREAEALTVFGARKTQNNAGRPKYLGLILTLLLLLAMAIVVVWSTFAIDDTETGQFNPPAGNEIVTGPVDPAPEPTAPSVPEPAQEPDPTTPEPPAATGEVLSPEAAEARYAATGIWQRAPEPLGEPETTRLDAVEVAALATEGLQRAPAPTPGEMSGPLRDALLAAPVPPPPPGTSFDLDESGLVRPTPEGALSPTGILVYSGRPALTPPPRQVAVPDAPPPVAVPDAPPPLALPGVPDTRPRPRPADLVTTPEPGTELLTPTQIVPAPVEEPAAPAAPPADDTTAPATDDNAALEGAEPADVSVAEAVLTVPRPEPRPDDLVVSTSSASAAIDAAVDDVIAAALVDATEYAVSVSRKPAARPGNFAKIVDAAREAASDGSRVVAAAAPAPVPAAASAGPSIPTSASVATRATMKNALNLRDINLIGIYGTSNARRALVRMGNGRYVKVEVGDRLDGGRVTSITATELTYQKGNRAYKLAVLPLG